MEDNEQRIEIEVPVIWKWRNKNDLDNNTIRCVHPKIIDPSKGLQNTILGRSGVTVEVWTRRKF